MTVTLTRAEAAYLDSTIQEVLSELTQAPLTPPHVAKRTNPMLQEAKQLAVYRVPVKVYAWLQWDECSRVFLRSYFPERRAATPAERMHASRARTVKGQVKTGRPRTCECGTCRKCKERIRKSNLRAAAKMAHL